jgi:hypothetical protein
MVFAPTGRDARTAGLLVRGHVVDGGGTPGTPTDPTAPTEPTESTPLVAQGGATLSGSGLLAGKLVVAPSPVDFGSVVLGGPPADAQLSVSNVGDVDVAIADLSVDPEGDFTVAGGECQPGLVVAPQTGCLLDVRFSPIDRRERRARLTVTDANGNKPTATLLGTGLAAILDIDPPQLDLGHAVVNRRSTEASALVSNLGDVSLTLSPTPLLSGHAADFAAALEPGCPSPLEPGRSCLVGLTFTPRDGGARSAKLGVSADYGAADTAQLTGVGDFQPLVVADPAVSQRGGIVRIIGSGFASGDTVNLSWQLVGVSQAERFAQVRASGDGQFVTTVTMAEGRPTGVHKVTAEAVACSPPTDSGLCATGPFNRLGRQAVTDLLVEAGTVQPAGFVVRR